MFAILRLVVHLISLTNYYVFNIKGITKKHIKGHNAIVFCVNYNTASNLLVSGGCEGDIRIWNVAKGSHLSNHIYHN